MPFQSSGSIRYFFFESLRDESVVHAMFTRHGGTSPAPWAALNVGGSVGDLPGRVAENRRLAMRSIHQEADTIYDVWQVHSAEVAIVEAPRLANQAHVKADAILTDRRGVNLFMRFADCVPVLLFDPVKRVAGIAHAGWQGTIARVARAAVLAMRDHYGSKSTDIIAALGPSICAQHYEIGPEVIQKVEHAFGSDSLGLLRSYNGKPKASGVHFDLWAANQLILEHAGLKKIEVSGICTACHNKDWYSHRAEAGRTGRFGVSIGIE